MPHFLLSLIFLLGTTAKDVEWLNLPEAFTQAQEEQTPLLIYVQAPWCGPCKVMERDVFPQTTPLLKRFTLARLNFDDHESTVSFAGRQMTSFDWAQHMGIEATPGFVLTEPDGTIITHFTGYLDKQRFSLLLAFVATGAYQHDSFKDYVQQAGY